MVLTPRRWRSRSRIFPPSNGGKKARSPGRARSSLLKPLRAGMPDDPALPVVTTSCAFIFCTRDCGCGRHPAFPTPQGRARPIPAGSGSPDPGRVGLAQSRQGWACPIPTELRLRNLPELRLRNLPRLNGLYNSGANASRDAEVCVLTLPLRGGGIVIASKQADFDQGRGGVSQHRHLS